MHSTKYTDLSLKKQFVVQNTPSPSFRYSQVSLRIKGVTKFLTCSCNSVLLNLMHQAGSFVYLSGPLASTNRNDDPKTSDVHQILQNKSIDLLSKPDPSKGAQTSLRKLQFLTTFSLLGISSIWFHYRFTKLIPRITNIFLIAKCQLKYLAWHVNKILDVKDIICCVYTMWQKTQIG